MKGYWYKNDFKNLKFYILGYNVIFRKMLREFFVGGKDNKTSDKLKQHLEVC